MLSVLDDEQYRQQPILCKDFIIDPYQIWLARFFTRPTPAC